MAIWIAAIAVGTLVAEAATGAVPTPAELDDARRWVASVFDGNPQPAMAPAYIEVLANHGPVQTNGRGGKPLRLGNQEFSRGIYCHAPSKLVVHLPGPGKKFEAVVGVDANDQTAGGKGSVVFVVTIQDKEAWRSDVVHGDMKGTPASVDLGGAAMFVLEVTDAGDGIPCDQADWGDAKVTLEDGSVLWLGDLPLEGQARVPYTTGPFFSFTYGGKPSAELLSIWKVERATRKLDDARTEHTLAYTDPQTGLVVRCVGIEYADFPTVEWTSYFKNTGTADTPILSDVRAIDTQFMRDTSGAAPGEFTGEFALHHHTGDLCTPESYEPHVETLGPKADKRIANTGGRPTQSAFPYFNIEYPGGGVIVVVSWAGQWAAQFQRDDANGLEVRAGQELTHFTLHPGEEVRSPLMALQFWKGDRLHAQNVWRSWMFAHNVPRPGGKPLEPFRSLCNGNFYPGLMTNAAQEIAFIQRHLDEGVKFDYWWEDAGWYPCDGVTWPKTGTWEVDATRFPKGIREVSDFCRAHGVKTIVWFEPERVHPGTWLADTHPEWVFGGKDGGLLKLGEPECRKWLTDHIDRLLTDQGIDVYRQDFNIDPLPFWRANDTEDRQGITEIRHVEGYFAYWDELLRRRPGMFIDSCASGGRRNDLETLRRAVPLLRSDWYWGPEGLQCHTYGLSPWVPFHGTGFIYETGDVKSEYWVRSLMVAENSFGPGARGVEEMDFSLLRRMTQEHAQIAPYFLGDFYPLAPYSLATDVWMAWQFDRPDLAEGVVQVFRRPDSIYEAARLRLKGIEPGLTYVFTNVDAPGTREMSGRQLMDKGLPVTIGERPKAATFTYKAKK